MPTISEAAALRLDRRPETGAALVAAAVSDATLELRCEPGFPAGVLERTLLAHDVQCTLWPGPGRERLRFSTGERRLEWSLPSLKAAAQLKLGADADAFDGY